MGKTRGPWCPESLRNNTHHTANKTVGWRDLLGRRTSAAKLRVPAVKPAALPLPETRRGSTDRWRDTRVSVVSPSDRTLCSNCNAAGFWNEQSDWKNRHTSHGRKTTYRNNTQNKTRCAAQRSIQQVAHRLCNRFHNGSEQAFNCRVVRQTSRQPSRWENASCLPICVIPNGCRKDFVRREIVNQNETQERGDSMVLARVNRCLQSAS